jgi:hypothetical protein
MSLDTYTNLKQEVIDFSHRGDLDLKIDTFIDMAETEMYANTQEVLKIRSLETLDTTATTTSRLIALPTCYQSMRSMRLTINSNTSNLRFRAPEQMVRVGSSGLPQFYTVTDQIEFDRTPDAAYTIEFQYYATPTGLSSSNATNVVLDDNPNIYLFGTLWAVFEYAVDEVQSQKYYTRFINAIKGANKKDKEGRYGPAPAMRIEGSTP